MGVDSGSNFGRCLTGEASHRASLGRMPTSPRRLWVTETPPVKEALDELREALGPEIPFEEVLIRGAKIKLAELREGD
jgi:hypothetical protein